jgi:hypothetical protein
MKPLLSFFKSYLRKVHCVSTNKAVAIEPCQYTGTHYVRHKGRGVTQCEIRLNLSVLSLDLIICFVDSREESLAFGIIH